MTRYLLAGTVWLLLSALAFAAPARDGLPAPPPSCRALSGQFLQHVERGDFKAAMAHFDTKMQAAVNAQQLKQLWRQHLPKEHGAFQRAGQPRVIHRGDHTGVITPLKFARGWQNMIVSCNKAHEIEGLFFRAAQAPAGSSSAAGTQAAASATAWVTTAAIGAKTLPITVERGGFVLKGVLDLPAGKGSFGVVDIIPGSGPVTLNGNDRAGPGGGIVYSPYKQLAASLIKAGWAVARVAKRGLPPSTGDGNKVVFADQVADNLAIVEALRKNSHVNAKRIVVAGHSIGGLIAPKLATKTKVAGLILLEAPGESMTKISTAQVLQGLQQSGASATKIKAITQTQNEFYDLVAKAPPGQSVSVAGQTISPNQVQLVKTWYAQKPLETARKVGIPVLVVQGGLDFNVPPGNGKRLVKALPHGKLLYIPKMGHALDVAHCRCVEQLDTGKDAKLAPGLTTGIVAWLKRF